MLNFFFQAKGEVEGKERKGKERKGKGRGGEGREGKVGHCDGES
jgi:hypothetical protein